jgi:hypothetical protein
MRFGALEVGIIILIILIIFGVTQLRKASVNRAPEPEEYEEPVRVRRYRSRPRRSNGHPRLQMAGIIVILVGVFVLLSSLNILSMLKWVFWGPIAALVIVALGVAAIFFARRS